MLQLAKLTASSAVAASPAMEIPATFSRSALYPARSNAWPAAMSTRTSRVAAGPMTSPGGGTSLSRGRVGSGAVNTGDATKVEVMRATFLRRRPPAYTQAPEIRLG